MMMMAVLLMLISGCGGHGTKLEFNGGELFYTDAVTEDEANKLGKYLVSSDFFDGNKKSVQLDKSDGRYLFRLVVKEGYDKNDEYKVLAKLMAYQLSANVFDGKPVDIHLCDNQLKTLSVVEYTPLEQKAEKAKKSE